MDNDADDNAMLRAADVARSRRTDDVRRRSRLHIDMADTATQTNDLGYRTETKLSREWFLWKQTTLLCSVTFTLILGTITQIKQTISTGTDRWNYNLLLCTTLCSLALQCLVVLLLLTLTKNESDWLKDIRCGTAKMQKIINMIMAAVFVISILEVCAFLLVG